MFTCYTSADFTTTDKVAHNHNLVELFEKALLGMCNI